MDVYKGTITPEEIALHHSSASMELLSTHRLIAAVRSARARYCARATTYRDALDGLYFASGVAAATSAGAVAACSSSLADQPPPSA